jgi:Mor family transcriptional regulator
MAESVAVTARYAKIYARWQELKNYAAVGREYGVTGDRISQIVAKYERMEKTRMWKESHG